MDCERRFLFRGSATGIGGHLRRPKGIFIPTQASATLPIIGGLSVSRSGPGKIGRTITYRSAVARAQGDYSDPEQAAQFTHGNYADNNLPTITTVSSQVRGLTIVNAGKESSRELKLANVAFTLESKIPERGNEPEIRAREIAFSGLSIDGAALNVTFVPWLEELATLSQLRAEYENNDKFFDEYGHCFAKPPGTRASKSGRKLPVTGGSNPGIVFYTIVKNIEWSRKPNAETVIDGNRITIPGFGSVYIGEMFATPSERRLSMMRVMLGSPEGGEVEVGGGDSNGHTFPP